MFTFGAYQPEQQTELLETLNRKIGEVYRSCIEDAGAGNATAPSSATGALGGARAAPGAAGAANKRHAAPAGGESNTLQMLTAIEHRLEELCDQIEALPRERVAEAERSKEKERRFKVLLPFPDGTSRRT